MSGIPAEMRALVTSGDGSPPLVKTIPVPAPGADELLIRVSAVSQNPGDHYLADNAVLPDLILGSDVAGTVAAVGARVQGFQPGDRVATMVHCGMFEDRGGMAEYVVADATLVWRIPEGKSFEEASTMNCALWTAIQALFHTSRLELTQQNPADGPGPWILIYSGATSVGQYAIQLARVHGYRVVTTASPRNAALVASLGADAVFDYRDADVAAKIRDVTGDALAIGLDTIAQGGSLEKCIESFGKSGGKLISVLQLPKGINERRKDVTVHFTLIYSALGRAFNLYGTQDYPAAPGDKAQMAAWMPRITELWQTGKLRPNKVQIWPGGLDAVKDGLEYMKAGKLSATKLVYNI